MKGIVVRAFWLILFLFSATNALGASETVNFPLTLDYQLIKSLFNFQAFNKPGDRAILLGENEKGDCNYLELGGVEVSPEKSLLKLKNKIKIRAGLPILGKCVKLGDWEGDIEVLQRVMFDEKTQKLRFEPVSSEVFNKDLTPAKLSKPIRDIIQTYVFPFLSQISIDLAFPSNELKRFLPLVFSPGDRARIEKSLNTMRFTHVRVEKAAVKLDILMDIETVPKPKKADTGELSPEKIQSLSKTWESWDAFSVYQIESLIGKPLTENERTDLLDTILDTRSGFVRSLTDKTLSSDLVKEQFVWTWQKLATNLRKYLVTQPSLSLLKYLSFFTASDALVALDKLGPELGLDISRDGLLRLAKLLSAGETEPGLDYSYAVNPELRTLFGFGPPLDASGPAFDVQEIKLPDEQEEEGTQNEQQSWLRFLLPMALAADLPSPSVEELDPWIPPKKDCQPYLDQVRKVLERAADETLSKNQLDEKYQPLYRLVVLATAWQESCWRQFIKEKGTIRYLLSWTQSSVGMMQINERVWRGLYQPESLRWNIAYNAGAGSEVLMYYFSRYALKKIDPANPPDMDTLARAVYAMYNGGPGDFKKFLQRKETNTLYQSDQLFWQKYSLAKDSQFDKVSVCLVGK